MVATGGRPSKLDIPGGDLAITSDDLFMKVYLLLCNGIIVFKIFVLGFFTWKDLCHRRGLCSIRVCRIS